MRPGTYGQSSIVGLKAAQRTCTQQVEDEGQDEEVSNPDSDRRQDEDVTGLRLGERVDRPDTHASSHTYQHHH